MRTWDAHFDRQCTADIGALLRAPTDADRIRAWQSLLAAVAPFIEGWAEKNWVLKRFRLDGPDDARAVLVAVLERLQKNDYANLARFEGGGPKVADAGDEERATVLWAARFDEVEREDSDAEEADAVDKAPATPFRGWLLTLVRYCAADHVRHRVGWAKPSDGAPGSKRDLGTDAQRFADLPPSGIRPPVTDYVRLRRFVAEVESFTDGFPPAMQVALTGWLEGRTFAELAALDGIADAAEARRLVRAAKTRLRAQFRDSPVGTAS